MNSSLSVSPQETTAYTITAAGQAGTVTWEIIVYVNSFSVLPTIDFTVSPGTITPGGSTTLSWNIENAPNVHIDQGIGGVEQSGSINITPDHTTTYTLTANSPKGVVNERIRVHVNGNPETQPAGSFGDLYNSLIPADSTMAFYDPERFGLITGRILDISNTPLSGINVTLLGHPEYGTATTDTDGRYSIPVEGGNTFTVIYTQNAYLTAQRQVYVPVNDVGIAEIVQLLQEDPLSTDIILDGNSSTVITHKSSVISDAFGERSLSMVFQGDNRAYIVDENGDDIQEITSFTTRATEYQTPESMPAKLPPTSAFTYCTELSADGVDRVRFENPIITWVDNFLGFETGFTVPSGYYDRDKGIWIASENGIVVELLDTDNDGQVDSVDGDGDGSPDDLNNNGDVTDEALGLSDPQVYQPGTSYMRVEVTHFTPWDYNPCTFKSLLNLFGYERPTLPDQPCPDCPQSSTGSSVGNQSLIFYENIAIPGTGLSLAYASDRTDGFKNIVTVPVTGATVHPDVKRIVVELEIAGQKLKKTLLPTQNQMTEFVWDGLDWLGNRVFHKVTAHVKIGYVYDSSYMNSNYLRMSFAEFGTTATMVPSRQEVINWQRSDLTVNVADKSHGLAQGWSISAHHRMTPTDPSTLHKGDGSVANNITTVMTTIAGNGQDGWPLDGANAVDTPIGHPTSVAMDGKGNLYVANQVYSAILKIDKKGIVEVIAGGSQGTSEDDDIDAESAMLQIPADIAFDSNGNLYLADAGSNKIRKIDPQGIITTLAGNGNAESSGDNGPALDAGIMPSSVTADDFGNIYFAEGSSCVGGDVDPVTGECIGGQVVEGSYRIRKISTNGMISTIVGTGEKYDPDTHASIGDNGPASDAYLQNPTSVSLDQDGNLYIADGSRIRKVNTSGYITTVAGTGYTGYTGDGGLATDAQITQTSGVTFDKSGNFYFSQYYGNGDVIRKVTGTGYISTVAGKGEPGMDGDNGPATQALLKQPQRLAIDPNGFIYIPDKGNGLVRMVSIDAYSNEETRFTESSGLGHLISAEGFHTSTYDLKTGADLLTFEYDGQKDLTSITDQLGNVITIERLAGIPSAIISPDGMRTDITLDSNRQLTRMTLPDSSAFDFEYDHNNGLLTAKDEPNGNRFEHFFDENGRITKTNDQEGGLWEFSKTKTHDGKTTSQTITENTLTTVTKVSRSSGEVGTTVTAPTGETSYTFTGADGLSSSSWTPCGIETTSISDLDRMYGFTHLKERTITTPAGLVQKTTIGSAYVDSDFNGIPELVTETITTNDRVTTRTHDVTNAGRIITSPENRVLSATYDPATLLTLKSEVAGLHPADYSYFADGKLSAMTTGDRTTRYTYDPQGNLATVTDPQNKVTRFTDYDALGRVTRVEQRDGSVLAYEYDENGNMTLLTTPVPADHLFDYNGINKPSTQTTPLNSITRYAYNKERLLTSVTLPSDKVIQNTYVNGRLTETATSEWTNLYAYTCGNLPASITRGPEEISYEYDGALPTSSSQAGTLNQSLELVYNNDFNLTAFTYAGATQVFEYDNDSLVTGAGRFSITRNPNNGLPEQVSDNTFTLDRSFNGYGEVENVTARISGSTRLGYTLTRDHNGRITTRDLTVSGTNHTYDYTYDDFGRLLTVTEDGIPTEEYRYDNNGNRTYETNTHFGITGRTFTHSIEDHIITTDTATYEFDTDDRLSKVTEGSDITDYVYFSTGELVSVTLPDDTRIDYTHDPLGRRIAKKINGTIVEKYLWSGQTTLLAVFDGNDNLLQRFEYGDDRMPNAMQSNGTTYYLAYDQVGTLRLVTDTAGVVIKQIDYDSFGDIIIDTNPFFTVPFGFAGGLHDRDTGLVRFGYRDYMPKIGKWTAKDPIGFAGGDSNLYGYVLNDPINLVDLNGLMTMDKIVFAVDFAEGFLMPTSPPPTPGGLAGYLARDRFDTYVDLDKVKDIIVDSWIEYLDSDPFTRPKKPFKSPYKPGEYYWESASPCK
jgi:RHS repeat-associated protein